MKIEGKLKELPLTRANKNTLESLFGTSDIEPMWVADSEFQVALPIQEALIQRITNSGFGYEYKPDSFFEALRHWYQTEYQVNIPKEHIIFSPDIPTTITFAIETLTSKGDGIIIQPPVWIKFRNIIKKTGRSVIKNPLELVDGKYTIDYEHLRNLAKDPNNKMLILCNPHNPVGRVWTKDELDKIIAICRDNDLYLISDEIHKDIVLFNHIFTSALHYESQITKLIICTSEAKTFNLPGISDSMAVIPNSDLRSAISAKLKHYDLGRTNALTRVALEVAYTNCKDWLLDLRNTIELNVITIEEALARSNSRIKLIKPEGTFQVWLDFSEIFSDSKEMLQIITQESQLGLNAGHWFGREGALFMRMSIGTSNSKVEQAIEKLIEVVEGIS